MSTIHSARNEMAVLASILQRPAVHAEVQLMLTPDDFYGVQRGELYLAMLELAERDQLDPVRLMTHFTSLGRNQNGSMSQLIAELSTDSGVIPSNVSWYASRVRELSRARRFAAMFERGRQVLDEMEAGYREQAGDEEFDIDRLQMQVASVLLEGEILVDEKLNDTAIAGLLTYAEFLAVPDRPEDWLVHDLFGRQDVWMVLGGEGGGKSWFSRQMVLTMGAGIHPFRWEQSITPVRSLLIDLENADSMIRRQSRAVHQQALMHGDYEALNANTHIWTKQDGLNLRAKPDQLMFQAVLDRVRPEFVAMGSLYNAFQKGRDDWETAAEDVKVFLNRMRARYGFTVLLEHHMPKGDGVDRPKTPYGSSVWQRWVTHGRVLNKAAENIWELSLFRGDRDPRPDMPAGLTRGGRFPWSPIWTQDDLDARIEIMEEAEALRNPDARRPARRR